MDKQTYKFVILSGLGLLVLGTGACRQQPPVDNQPPTTPISPKPAAVLPGADSQAQTAGTTADANSGTGSKIGAQQKGGRKGSPAGPSMARSGGDPFAPAGMQPGRTVRPGTSVTMAQPPRVLVYSGRRKDPFYIDWKLAVPPPYVFDEVEPIRLASDAIETPPAHPYEVREQPEMRVSGIMTGDGVFAILESGGSKVDVVKPGSSVEISVEGQTKRTYKVVSITKDKVKLRSQVGNVIYTQEVPLSDVAVGTPGRGGFGGPGAMPGMFGGPSQGSGSGFPGLRPGGASGAGSSGGRRGGGASGVN